MSYKALYLTYRPQTFEEVAGQNAIVRTLRNSLKTGRLAHAYVFAGPRGTGKTTMARLLAKALNCGEGIGHQCCHCSSCIAIAEGEHPDVIEIDGASNNGVDQVRELIERVRYAPLKGRYKVYIIDEAHMISTQAFNALLKTLEEPPENVIFILATTEPGKILPTIMSRCQRFDFGRVDESDMERKLREVLSKEKANYDEAALKEIIALSDGGMRDALSILDQALAYSGGDLHEQDLLEIYGLVGTTEKIELLKALEEGNAKEVLEILGGYRNGGIDIRRLNDDLVSIMKDLLVYHSTKESGLLSVLNKAEAEKLASMIPPQEAKRLIGAFLQNTSDFRNSASVSSLFEISLLNLMEGKGKEEAPSRTVEVKEEPKPKVEKAEEKIEVKEPEPVEKVEVETPITPQKGPEPEVIAKKKEEPKKPASPLPDFLFANDPEEEQSFRIDPNTISNLSLATSGESYEISDEDLIKIMVSLKKEERQKLKDDWKALDEMKLDLKLGPLASLLSQGTPYCVSQEALILSYKYKNLKDKVNLKANQKSLEEMVEAFLGRKVFVIAIDHVDQNRVRQIYSELLQVKKLPRKEEIALNLPKV